MFSGFKQLKQKCGRLENLYFKESVRRLFMISLAQMTEVLQFKEITCMSPG